MSAAEMIIEVWIIDAASGCRAMASIALEPIHPIPKATPKTAKAAPKGANDNSIID